MNWGVAELEIREPGIPMDHVESSETTVLFTGIPPIVAVTVLPGSPTPENIAVSSSEILVSRGTSTSKSIPMTSMLIGIEFALEPY